MSQFRTRCISYLRRRARRDIEPTELSSSAVSDTFLAERPIVANHFDRPGRKLGHRNPAKIDDGRSERGNIRPIIPAQYTEVIGSDVIVIHLDYQAAGVNDRNRTDVLQQSPQGG